MRIDLPYGRTPYPVDLDGEVVLVEARGPNGEPPALRLLLERALDAPIASPRLEALARAGDRVTVVVSDATRDEPRGELLAAVRDRLPAVQLTVAVATGTHGPCPLEALGIPPALLAGAELVMHDGHRPEDLVDLGVTRRGTHVRVHRCAVDADLVIATGAIRPHYFAGFGAGAKAIYPGLGDAVGIRCNHLLKQELGARAGNVVGNPCRDDLEEAARMIPGRAFLLDGVCDPDDRIRNAVAGDLVAAFRVGVDLARPWFEVRAPRSRCVIASDALPVTASLYQASKIVAAVAPLVADDGVVVLVAECAEGIGPLAVVNEAIFGIGIRPRLPARHRVVLISALPSDVVNASYAEWAPSVAAAIDGIEGPFVVAPHASKMIAS